MEWGGLGDDFEVKFRQLFISRMVPPQTHSALGLPHIRGVLLHGPPGRGKTLICAADHECVEKHQGVNNLRAGGLQQMGGRQ